MQLQEVEFAVYALWQAQRLNHLVDKAEPADPEPSIPFGYLVVDVASLEHGARLVRPADVTQSALDPTLPIFKSSLAPCALLCFLAHHSKLLFFSIWLRALITKAPEFRVFFLEFVHLPNEDALG
jgi:hypothetical protein